MGLKIVVNSERMSSITALVNGLQNTAAMKTAMARGLNEHLRKQATDSVTTVAAQTALPKGMVQSGTTIKPASAASLTGAVKMQGQPVLAGAKTSRAWNKTMAGAKHGDWPTYTKKGGMMAHTFMAYGQIMRRKGKGRGPLQAVWGPVFPNEMLRQDMPNWKRAGDDVRVDLQRRVVRALQAGMGF